MKLSACARSLALPVIALLALNACGGAADNANSPVTPSTTVPSAPASSSNQEFLSETETGVRTQDGYHLNKVTEGAPTVTLFTDLECPYCAKADPTYAQVAGELEGTMNVTVKHFPLPMHDNAVPAAQAVQAAELQGAHQKMADHIYKHQSEWKELTTSESLVEAFTGYAEELGLDQEQFGADLNRDDQFDLIQSEYEEGKTAGVTGTPQFVVDGQVVAGVESSTSVEAMVVAFKKAANL